MRKDFLGLAYVCSLQDSADQQADHAKIERISKERYESCEQLDRLFHIRL